MDEGAFLEVARSAIMVMIKISSPVLLAGLGIGLIISLFQALTQIQETTLTFVPKVMVVFFTLLLALPFMLHTLMDFFHVLIDHVTVGG